MKNKFLLVLLITSLVINTKSVVLFADTNNFETTSEFNETEYKNDELETKINNNDIEDCDSEVVEENDELELELETELEIELESESNLDFDDEEILNEKEIVSKEETETLDEIKDDNEIEDVDEERINETLEQEQELNDILEKVELSIENSKKKSNDTYGSDGRVLYFAYFKEDMSDFDLYTFTNDDSDAVTIANINVEKIHFYDKRYNGVINLGIYPFNMPNIRNNYKWDDPNIYTDTPQSLFNFFDYWKWHVNKDETIICATYAKLKELTVTKHTINTEYQKGEKFSPDGLEIDVKFGNNETDHVVYSSNTKDRFKFYNNDTGEEITTDTVINNDFTLKVVYGDLPHGNKALSVIENTVYIYCVDPASEKGLKVFYRDVDGNIKHVSIGKAETAEEFTDRIKTIITSDEVYNYKNIYQGYYILSHYSGDDYEPLFNWNDESVKYFNANFKNTIDDWINGGRSENVAIGIVFQERDSETFHMRVYYLKKNSEKTYEAFYENTNMEEFDEFLERLFDNIPAKYSRIRTYYNSTWLVIDAYDPDRDNDECKPLGNFRDKLIDWKLNNWRYSGNYDRNFFMCYERKPIESIELVDNPQKTNYQTDDVFDPSGLKVKIKYTTDEDAEPIYEEIDYNDKKSMFSFEPPLETKLNDSYNQIKVTCLEKDVYVNIFVEPEIASMSICKEIKYDTYSVGEKFNPDGLAFTINFKNGTIKEVVYNGEGTSLLKFEPDLDYELQDKDEGVKTYNVRYGSKNLDLNINVLKNEMFVIFYEKSGVTRSSMFIASESNIKTRLDEILKNGYTGFYAMSTTKYNESIKVYNKNENITLTKDNLLKTYDQFDGQNNLFFGAVVAKPKPTPTPVNPGTNTGGNGGGSGGGGGGSSIPNMNQQATNNVPTETSINIQKTIKDVLLKNSCKWNYDATNNKWKLVALDMFSMNLEVKNGFYLISNLNEDLINTVNNTYCFDNNGNMLTGFVNTIDNKTYFFENEKNINEGAMVFGWKKIQNAWYLFNPDGSMVKNSVTLDGYYLGSDGKLVEW